MYVNRRKKNNTLKRLRCEKRGQRFLITFNQLAQRFGSSPFVGEDARYSLTKQKMCCKSLSAVSLFCSAFFSFLLFDSCDFAPSTPMNNNPLYMRSVTYDYIFYGFEKICYSRLKSFHWERNLCRFLLYFCVDEPFRESGLLFEIFRPNNNKETTILFHLLFFDGPIWMHSSCYTFWFFFYCGEKTTRANDEEETETKPNQNRESSPKTAEREYERNFTLWM